jgi:hypothetical protein
MSDNDNSRPYHTPSEEMNKMGAETGTNTPPPEKPAKAPETLLQRLRAKDPNSSGREYHIDDPAGQSVSNNSEKVDKQPTPIKNRRIQAILKGILSRRIS